MTDLSLPADSPLAEYEARCLATALNLQRYYNECVGIMLSKEEGGLSASEKMTALEEMDRVWATKIVDEIAPLKRIIEV